LSVAGLGVASVWMNMALLLWPAAIGAASLRTF
jgi:hypothetical protein